MATVESYVKSVVCSTCLSSNRKLVHDKSLQLAVKLFPKYIQLNLLEDRVCWECHAMLVKLLRFHDQVLEAREIFNRVLVQKEGTVKPLTKLKFSEIVNTHIYPIPTTSTVKITRFPNVQPITAQNLPDINSDVESIPKFTISRVKEEFDDIDILKNEIGKSFHDHTYSVICKDESNANKENVEKDTCTLTIADLRHILIKEIKINCNNRKRRDYSNCHVLDTKDSDIYASDNYDDALDNLANEDNLGNENSLDNKDNLGHRTAQKIDKTKKDKNSKITIKAASRRSKKEKNNTTLKDIRIYKNVQEVDLSETQLQELREKERESEYFLAAKFKCEKCIFGYEEEGIFKAHLNKHKVSYGPHACRVCELRFQEENTLNLHYSNHFRAFVCTVCEFSSRFLQTVVGRCRVGCVPLAPPRESVPHTPVVQVPHTPVVQVPHTPAVVQTPPAPPAVGSAPPTPTVYTCKECDCYFATEPQLSVHVGAAHPRHRVCRHCDKRFTNNYNRNRHERYCPASGQGEEVPHVECKICHKVVKERGLHNHMRYTHSAERGTLYCTLCKKFFKSKLTYRTHWKTTAMHVSSQYQCDHCGKWLSSKAYMADHIQRMHQQQRKFQCGRCDKKYPTATGLRVHTRDAHGERARTHMCSQCGKAFPTKTILKRHMMIHTGAKPYQCEHCPWKFTQKSTLRTHQKLKHKDLPPTVPSAKPET